MKPNQSLKEFADHLNIDETKLKKILTTDYSELSKGLKSALFFTDNIREILTVFQITHQKLADHLGLTKAKMYRRFDHSNLWDLATLIKAIEYVDTAKKKKDG